KELNSLLISCNSTMSGDVSASQAVRFSIRALIEFTFSVAIFILLFSTFTYCVFLLYIKNKFCKDKNHGTCKLRHHPRKKPRTPVSRLSQHYPLPFSERPGPAHPLFRVQAAGRQNAGLCLPRRKKLPDAADAQH